MKKTQKTAIDLDNGDWVWAGQVKDGE
jgi:hypothetical protein